MNKIAYEKYLRKRGIHPDQIKQKKKELGSPNSIPVYKIENPVALSNTIPSNGTKSPDMSKAKFSNENYTIAPAYNKGAYQVLSRSEVITAGRKV